MSIKELERLAILTKVNNKHLRQSAGAKALGISSRQMRRLLRRFRAEGPKGVISRKMGSLGNHRFSDREKAPILTFFEDKDHYDFGPTLAHEYLTDGL